MQVGVRRSNKRRPPPRPVMPLPRAVPPLGLRQPVMPPIRRKTPAILRAIIKTRPTDTATAVTTRPTVFAVQLLPLRLPLFAVRVYSAGHDPLCSWLRPIDGPGILLPEWGLFDELLGVWQSVSLLPQSVSGLRLPGGGLCSRRSTLRNRADPAVDGRSIIGNRLSAGTCRKGSIDGTRCTRPTLIWTDRKISQFSYPAACAT